MLPPPFKSYHYNVEVQTPVHIGAAKENDYAQGQDYFYENGYYYFVLKRQLFKTLTNHQITEYSSALATNNVKVAETVLSKAADKDESLIYHSSYCPFEAQPSIKKHIADGFGNLIIPGSSLKGAIRSIIGKYLMQQTRQSRFDEKELFGKIDNNLMRYLQVGDVGFSGFGEITPLKIFSGDVEGRYQPAFEGIGQWKHSRNDGHSGLFKTAGFVTHAETLVEGIAAPLRLNWADELFKLVPPDKKHTNANYFHHYDGNQWLKIAQQQTDEYLRQELAFFEKFPNDDFEDATVLLNDLIAINQQNNTALIRLGAGSGFHAITGNWQYKDHTKTGQGTKREKGQEKLIDSIKYKTRKVAFYKVENDTSRTIYKQFPGFVKITLQP